jgi:hypothetical protein
MEGTFKLFNSAGMLVLNGKLSTSINFSSTPGIYYMEIESLVGRSFHKLLKN